MAPQQRKTSKKREERNEETNKSVISSKSVSEKKLVNKEETLTIPWRKIISRFLLSLLLIFTVYWTSKKDDVHVFASQKQKLQLTTAEMPCSPEYIKDISKFKECSPKRCGRMVTDLVVSPEEAAHLLRLSQKGLAFGGSDGGASILDVHSGALSKGNSFINIYKTLQDRAKKIFTAEDFKVYRNVKNKIQQIISYNFAVPVNKLYLTYPTFFSEMTTRTPKTPHDEYWHIHVDKETYPSFHYTSLLYLTDYGVDFTGGRFIFADKGRNVTVEPRVGRVLAFTSGAENPHYVERVTSGTRYALTVSFTCESKFAIDDPTVAFQ